jgi:mRNA-degrading endonuclease toxin of MazEF toxin-antitoxin module
VAERGEVLVARRRLGFAAPDRREHFVVLQSNALTNVETLVVAPLDDDAPLYRGDPLAVSVPAREAGTSLAQVVLAHLLMSVLADRFDAAASGRLSTRTMARVDDVVRTFLDL